MHDACPNIILSCEHVDVANRIRGCIPNLGEHMSSSAGAACMHAGGRRAHARSAQPEGGRRAGACQDVPR